MPRAHARLGLLSLAIVVAVATSSCATYREELDRARTHYEANEFPKALAVLRLLGDDLDALSEPEQAEYAYLRGMTDLRLSALMPTRLDETKVALRSCARDWLERSLEPGLLPKTKSDRAHVALADLTDAAGPRGGCLE